MITRISPPTDAAIAEAAALIRAGEPGGHSRRKPCTGWARTRLNRDAVAKIFQAKGRPGDNPLIRAHFSASIRLRR